MNDAARHDLSDRASLDRDPLDRAEVLDVVELLDDAGQVATEEIVGIAVIGAIPGAGEEGFLVPVLVQLDGAVVETPLARMLLTGEVRDGTTVTVDYEGPRDALTFRAT